MELSRPPSSRPMSRRGGLGGGSNDLSSASSGRIGTASRLSAMPNRLGTAKNIGIPQKGLLSDRPLTQQGLSGLSMSQGRLGTASGMRQVKDKRYWMALLQSKIQEIAQETEKLNNETKNFNRETSAKKLYEKKVKEQAKELSALQSMLSDMNLALDSTSTGATRQQLQNQALVFREKNELMQNQLEQTFKERQSKESQNQQLEAAIDNEKVKMNEMIYSLSESQQNRYRENQMMCENLKAENSEIHGKIEAAMKQKEKLSSSVINSQARLEAVKMHSKLREISTKRNQLIADEETNRLTPAQEREKLINEVKLNNQAISSINKQLKIVSDQLQEKKDYLLQIEQDLEEGSSERHIKYKELKKRDEMMNNFMETFQAQMAQEKQNVESLKNQITFLIEQITLQGINKFSSNMKVSSSAFSEKNDLNSHGGLLKEYGKLQIQLKQLKILEKRMIKQLDELRQEENDLLSNIQKFNNLGQLRSEYALKYEELSTNLEELRDKKRVTENVVAENERRNKSIKESLRSNETFRQISHLEEKLNDLMKDNKQLERLVDELNEEFDYSKAKKEASKKVDDYNALLCAELRRENSY